MKLKSQKARTSTPQYHWSYENGHNHDNYQRNPRCVKRLEMYEMGCTVLKIVQKMNWKVEMDNNICKNTCLEYNVKIQNRNITKYWLLFKKWLSENNLFRRFRNDYFCFISTRGIIYFIRNSVVFFVCHTWKIFWNFWSHDSAGLLPFGTTLRKKYM